MSRTDSGAMQGDALRALLSRLDEVRGLSASASIGLPLDPGDPGALLEVIGELVESLEKSHRRLIESNVQLVSLREVASRTLGTHDPGETARIVTRYLTRAFGFDHVFLVLADRERGRLHGAWTSHTGGHDSTVALDLPLLFEAGDPGSIARTF